MQLCREDLQSIRPGSCITNYVVDLCICYMNQNIGKLDKKDRVILPTIFAGEVAGRVKLNLSEPSFESSVSAMFE
ncbi:hypothetical protein LINGRAHAP2_LOCUS35025, partial [Linum grandiflorum]